MTLAMIFSHHVVKATETEKVKLCCMTITTGPGTAFTTFQVFLTFIDDNSDGGDDDVGGDNEELRDLCKKGLYYYLLTLREASG